MFVVSTETWPSQSRTVLMSTPLRRRWVAVERRIVCEPVELEFEAILNSLPAKKPRSRLEPYRELILEMRKRGRSYREIMQVLNSSCNLAVGKTTVHDFVRACTKSTRKRRVQGERYSYATNRHRQRLTQQGKTYKHIEEHQQAVAASKALEGITRKIKAFKDQPMRTHTKKVVFEYNPDEPLHCTENIAAKITMPASIIARVFTLIVPALYLSSIRIRSEGLTHARANAH
jgi:hypothetical protein